MAVLRPHQHQMHRESGSDKAPERIGAVKRRHALRLHRSIELNQGSGDERLVVAVSSGTFSAAKCSRAPSTRATVAPNARADVANVLNPAPASESGCYRRSVRAHVAAARGSTGYRQSRRRAGPSALQPSGAVRAGGVKGYQRICRDPSGGESAATEPLRRATLDDSWRMPARIARRSGLVRVECAPLDVRC